jgi:hypothetical protein
MSVKLVAIPRKIENAACAPFSSSNGAGRSLYAMTIRLGNETTEEVVK